MYNSFKTEQLESQRVERSMDGFRFDPTKFIVNDGAEPDLHAHEPHGDDASIFSFLHEKQKEDTTFKDIDAYAANDEIVGE